MKVRYHIAINIPLSIGVYFLFGSYLKAIVFFVIGIFIDIDHFFDYFYHNKTFSLKYFFIFFYYHKYKIKKLFIFFHSIDLIILFAIITGVFFGFKWALVIATASILHIFCDIFNNHFPIKIYFFVYRLFKRFNVEKIIGANVKNS